MTMAKCELKTPGQEDTKITKKIVIKPMGASRFFFVALCLRGSSLDFVDNSVEAGNELCT